MRALLVVAPWEAAARECARAAPSLSSGAAAGAASSLRLEMSGGQHRTGQDLDSTKRAERVTKEGKRATKTVYEDPKARRRGLQVALSGLTEPLFLRNWQ